MCTGWRTGRSHSVPANWLKNVARSACRFLKPGSFNELENSTYQLRRHQEHPLLQERHHEDVHEL